MNWKTWFGPLKVLLIEGWRAHGLEISDAETVGISLPSNCPHDSGMRMSINAASLRFSKSMLVKETSLI